MASEVPPTARFDGFNCPKCGSDNTATFASVNAGGVSHTRSSSSHAAAAFGGGGFIPVLGSSSTSGVQQTELARKTAPPDRRPVYGIGKLIGCLFLAPLVAFVIAIIVSLVYAVFIGDTFTDLTWVFLIGLGLLVLACLALYSEGRASKAWNKTEHPKLLQEWRNQWLCLRCGDSFIPGQDSTGVETQPQGLFPAGPAGAPPHGQASGQRNPKHLSGLEILVYLVVAAIGIAVFVYFEWQSYERPYRPDRRAPVSQSSDQPSHDRVIRPDRTENAAILPLDISRTEVQSIVPEMEWFDLKGGWMGRGVEDTFILDLYEETDGSLEHVQVEMKVNGSVRAARKLFELAARVADIPNTRSEQESHATEMRDWLMNSYGGKPKEISRRFGVVTLIIERWNDRDVIVTITD